MRATTLTIVMLACACGPKVLAGDDDASGDATTSVSTTAQGTTSNGTSTGTSSTGTTTFTTTDTGVADTSDVESGVVDEGGPPSCAFICPPDDCFNCGPECDLWAQDCPRGEKCMPWANDGGNAWNDVKCSPIAPDPNQPGEPCTVEGSGVSGIDDCDIGSMCWNVDPETNMGTCVAMCTGSANDPQCPGECDVCSISGEGVLILCLPTCDPLVAPCPDGQTCTAINDGFACAPDASGLGGAAGDPCEFVNACDPGLFCADTALLPDCDSMACCTPYCDTTAADPCPGAAPGIECVPWWARGQEPPPNGCTSGALGACVLP
jgi:hypothetical protein